ncbi:MAG: GNAT family N-acetyltransferase, partial [Puniceicoccaceae bacterium]
MTDSPDFEGVTLQCGWGRLIFAHTFPSPAAVAREILREQKGQRDIAFYLNDPHLVLNEAPQDLFLDPSLTYRLRFGDYAGPERAPAGFEVGPVRSRDEIAEINRIYISHKMVPVDADYLWRERGSPLFRYLVARALDDGRILGVVLGVDHRESFSDIENGSSLWALAVDKQADLPGVGECLVRATVEEMRERGRIQLDLSVMHDNEGAIGLYRKLGFHKVAVFAVKCRNSINERLFIGDPPDPEFNPYAEIIINEALRRGIRVSDTDPARGFFTLSLGGRSVTCRESLTEMTSAVAVMRCDDKSLTRELLERAGLQVPAQQRAADPPPSRTSFAGSAVLGRGGFQLQCGPASLPAVPDDVLDLVGEGIAGGIDVIECVHEFPQVRLADGVAEACLPASPFDGVAGVVVLDLSGELLPQRHVGG